MTLNSDGSAEQSLNDIPWNKGTYSVAGNKITVTVTHVYGPSLASIAASFLPEGMEGMDLSQLFPSQWFTQAELENLISTIFAQMGITPDQFVANGIDMDAITEEIDALFASVTVSYSLNGNELTTTQTIDGETLTTVYTKAGSSGEKTSSSSSVETESSSSVEVQGSVVSCSMEGVMCTEMEVPAVAVSTVEESCEAGNGTFGSSCPKGSTAKCTDDMGGGVTSTIYWYYEGATCEGIGE